MKIEKQEIWLLLFVLILLGFLAYLFAHDPYEAKNRDADIMAMILSRMGLAPFFNGF